MSPWIININLTFIQKAIVSIYIYIYTNLPVNAIVRLPHPGSGDSHGQETFFSNHDIECSNHHSSLSTPRPKGLSRSKMKWWAIYIYTNLPVNVIVRLPHTRRHNTTKHTYVSALVAIPTLMRSGYVTSDLLLDYSSNIQNILF